MQFEDWAGWTIDELGRQVAEALAVDYAGSPSNRVRDVPDRRTIRYYTTLGLLDRPHLRGRLALYGTRHLLQLVAIKRLQAERMPLAQIQRTLLGLTNEELAKIARLSLEITGVLPKGPAKLAAAPADRSFWKETAAAAVSEVS